MTYTDALRQLIKLREYSLKNGIMTVFMRRKAKPHEFYTFIHDGKHDGTLVFYTSNPKHSTFDCPSGNPSTMDRLENDWELVVFKPLKQPKEN